MRWIQRACKALVWFIVTLPFRIVFFLFRWIFNGNRNSRGNYVIRKKRFGNSRYEHREIAEQVLARRLERWEVVHHINGRRDDNRPSNLCVMSRHNHDRYHKWYHWMRKTHGKYPHKGIQLRKLQEEFNGVLLTDKKRRGQSFVRVS